jgi:polar amino acid transport system substrate-binding protein
LTLLAVVGAACANGASASDGGGPGSGADSVQETLLDHVLQTGVLRVATDPRYPPQSYYDAATDTWRGFDIDVATEIARRLGVKIRWETPAWDVVTAGRWEDRWDLSVGSMTITAQRAELLDFSSPYYYTPAGFAVRKGSVIASIGQLAGKQVGVCGACTYEYYLERKLDIPGYRIAYAVPRAIVIRTYGTDTTAIQDLVSGRLDAVMSAVPTLQRAIDEGSPIELLGAPVFYDPLAAAADKSSSLDPTSFIAKVSSIIDRMHLDGTLSRLSMKWYGTDLTVNPFGG